jgi:hypothetical protein
MEDKNKSAYIIAYGAFTFWGFLVGLGVGWWIWH